MKRSQKVNQKILFFGKKDCSFTLEILNFLKSKYKIVIFITSNKIGDKLNEDNKIFKSRFDYLFSFRCHFIFDKILKKINKYAINFHPSTPKYRGSGGVNYATMHDKYFGCTAHLIDKKIDHGKIIDVMYFDHKKMKTLEEVLNSTYSLQVKQFKNILKNIIKNDTFINDAIRKNKVINWGKSLNNKKQLVKKIRSTLIGKFKPYVVLHGKKFILDS